MYEKESLANER